ncbi:hypothetical protein GCM10010472_65440 [Pseudonocardia halophobica]|uniref:Short subunit dehydrogenase n=1 Tax=Pseudonocardia halophobica TaxID=29401 RepID=A0A9W6L6V9_9PSEU|nr:hypothetical protein GCM10017577_51400 [Pseudonocardia halophobica]
MDLNLRGARAIVTGGSRGIGFAVAQELTAEGARARLVARHPGRLADTTADLRPAAALALPTDTTNTAAVGAMVERIVAGWGGVDALVNAAEPAIAMTGDNAISADLDTNILCYLRCARAVATHMTAEGAGRIINVSGFNARRTGSLAGTIRSGPPPLSPRNTPTSSGRAVSAARSCTPGRRDRADSPTSGCAPGSGPPPACGGRSGPTTSRTSSSSSAHQRAAAVTRNAVGVAGGNRGDFH